MNLRDTLEKKGEHLVVGGCDTVDLVKQYGTPLYVLDESYIRKICRVYMDSLKGYGKFKVLFASKALCCKGIYRITSSEGLGCDVVSGGELYTAMEAGVEPDKIYFHGNNKTEKELRMAIERGVYGIVLDSIDEIEFVNTLAIEYGRIVNVMLRVNPGVEAHTHHYIQTARTDSKFGFCISTGFADEAVQAVIRAKQLHLLGFHSHIGSNIFEFKPFAIAVDVLTTFMAACKAQYGLEVEELNLGGGFGIYYNDDDRKMVVSEYSHYTQTLIDAVEKYTLEKGLRRPTLIIEPGRSIVGEAGITLYTVGNIKNIEGIKKYVSVDGGMFDNPRFALYQAKYTACLANRMNDPAEEKVTVAGKCCESGDILVEDAMLPVCKRGDVLCVFSTGAYNYSMASNYNRNAIPPMILCNNGRSEYLVKPQTFEDLVRNDVYPQWLDK